MKLASPRSFLIPRSWTGTCAVVWALASGLIALAEPPATIDDDTAAALAVLDGLTPHGQRNVLAAMEESLAEGELGVTRIPLLAALIDNSPWSLDHRRQVAFLLAALGTPGQEALERLSFSPDKAVRIAAIEGLQWTTLVKKIRTTAPNQREHVMQQVNHFVREHPAVANRARDVLLAVYAGQEPMPPEARVEALRGLVRLAPRSIPAIVQSLQRPDPFYFEHGKAALLAVGAPAQAPLVEALQHRDPRVRERVVYVLAELKPDDDAVAAVRRLERDPDPTVRKAVAWFLTAF